MEIEWKVDVDDALESFLGALVAGIVLIFVVLPLARRMGFRLRLRRR